MNINEYKQNKKREVKQFLEGLKFDNIGINNKKIISGLTPECSDFFNRGDLYRSLTERFLNNIHEEYINLIDTNIEYASTVEEIDYEIKKFVDNVKNIINDYKYNLIKAVFIQKKEEGIIIDNLPEVKEKNLLYTGLNFIKIKIGDKIYSSPKIGREAEKEDVTVDNITPIIIYILYNKLHSR